MGLVSGRRRMAKHTCRRVADRSSRRPPTAAPDRRRPLDLASPCWAQHAQSADHLCHRLRWMLDLWKGPRHPASLRDFLQLAAAVVQRRLHHRTSLVRRLPSECEFARLDLSVWKLCRQISGRDGRAERTRRV